MFHRHCNLISSFMFALLLAAPAYAANPRTFRFTLAGDCKTSGGVYDSAGTLIRTLWSGQNRSAGTYNVSWDGNYDQHAEVIAPAPEGTYILKVLANNVRYNWDGVVGNTSSSFASPNIWKALHAPADLAINSNGMGIMTAGFCEGQPNARHFLTSDPQTPTPFPDSRDGISVWSSAAVDGSRYYISIRGSDWDENSSNFIIARNIADDSVYAFPNGQDATLAGATGIRTFAKSIDVSQKSGGHDRPFVAQNMIIGLAVQQSGNVLASSHGALNLVRLFDKTSGAALGQISITAPGKLSFSPNGDLWVVNGSTVSQFAAGTLGQTNTPVANLSGLINPISVAASLTDNNLVLVMENATSQIKCYTFTTQWNPAWTLGQEGGYNAANGPDVTEDAATVKFSFGINSLTTQADGSFWVADFGCNRFLHYAADRSYLGQIGFVSSSGAIVADPNVPTRIISNNLLEYKIDYTKPLVPGDPGSNGAWKLVKNWRAGLEAPFNEAITSMVTLEGHTYATVKNTTLIDHVFELPAKGNARKTDAKLPGQGWSGMYNNGDFRVIDGEGSGTIRVKNVAGSGFASGNPTWDFSNPTILASTPANAPTRELSYDPSPWGTRMPVTSSNKVILFNGNVNQAGDNRTIPGSYHLGAVKVGGTNWSWRGSPGKLIFTPDGQGSFTNMGIFGGLGGLQAFAEGTDVLWGFNGQYASFSNQFAHFDDDGLFVGQFGVPQGNETVPGFAGNFLGMFMVKAEGKLYVYTSDESGHAGIARWCISGLDRMKEITGAITQRPGDPTYLVANPSTATQMRLKWSDNSSNETGFEIERATNPEFTQEPKRVGTVKANTTTCIDSGLTLYKRYYYRVKATNRAGDSNYTNVSFNEPADKLTGTVIASDGGGSGTEVAKAFDGDLKTYFRPGVFGGGGWLGYDLGSPKTFSTLKFAAVDMPNHNNITDGKFQVSNTADFSSDVVDLYHVVKEPPSDKLTVIEISPHISGYRYVRFFGNNAPNYMAISEMEVFGSSSEAGPSKLTSP